MHERMQDKYKIPSQEDIAGFVRANALKWMQSLERSLSDRYDLVRELRYPFGQAYGWGYKYAHKTKHLCYLFFERGSFTVTLQIGGKEVSKLEVILPASLPKTRACWEQRYPCGKGGWVHYPVRAAKELQDILQLIAVKKQPVKKPQ